MKKILFSLIILVSLSGCEKYLNVNPINKAYEEELCNERSGFESALAGIYVSMNSEKLFGLNLKYGFVESMVGTYNSLGSSHRYYRSYRHEYNYENPKGFLEEIWGDSYKIINQTNIILENLDKIKSDKYYNLIKGEAISIRAFMHFQLLKLYGPVIKEEGAETTAIPYKDKVDFKAEKFQTAAQVITKLQADLLEAKSLLEDDPIRTNDRDENLNIHEYEKYNSLIDYRGTRLNYYAVLALQAQVAQWAGDLSSAKNFAEELIAELESKESSIHLATSGELAVVSNKRQPMENIFALLNQNLLLRAMIVHPTLEDTRSSSSTPLLFPNYSLLNTKLYSKNPTGSLNDFRLLNWFARQSTSSSWKFVKYIFPVSYLFTDSYYKPLFENKIISLHTIYLIAAEEYAKSNPSKAITYLNKLRNARNVTNNIEYTSSMTEEDIKNLLFEEMRKDNVGEGTLFAEYKRLFREIDRNTNVQPNLNIFKLPIPDDELLYNPQN